MIGPCTKAKPEKTYFKFNISRNMFLVKEEHLIKCSLWHQIIGREHAVNLPAKLEFARWCTCNMHASLVLLNWPLALGTWF